MHVSHHNCPMSGRSPLLHGKVAAVGRDLIDGCGSCRHQIPASDLESLKCQHAFASIEVKAQLPKKYSPAKEMHKAPPLDISADVKEKDASGYKVPFFHNISHVFALQLSSSPSIRPSMCPALAQAPWSAETCAVSIKVNGLYEASGLALWVRSGVYSNSVGKDFDPGDVSFGALEKFLDSFFSKDVAMKGHITRGSKKQKQVKLRMLWPVTMVCGCDSPGDVEDKRHFDSSLNAAGGHFVVWAWYLALSRALQKNDSRNCSSKSFY